METMTFSIPRARFVNLFTRQALMLGAVGAFSALQLHRNPVYTLGATLLSIALLAAALIGSRTTVSEEGIRLRYYFIPTALRPWADIASIEEEQVRRTPVLRLRLKNGKQYTLPHPIGSPTGPDPDYPARRDQVLALWRKRSKR